MKKIFTLITVALVAMSVNAQETVSYKAISVAGDGTKTLAPEFAAIVDGSGKATNVTKGRSVVKIDNSAIIFKAVGGTTPANADGGAQQITPNTDKLVEARVEEVHGNIYEVASVEAWNDITWANDKNSDPIAADGSNINILMGAGNPYTVLLAEEIETDGTPTGTYRAKYKYYVADGSNGMPITGLYYKFTPKANGTLKVTVWSNKNNRNTFVVKESTGLPMAHYTDVKIEGYINGQKAKDGDNTLTDVNGKEILKLFTNAEIKERHDGAKVADGVDSAPYVIDTGGQPFWGTLTLDVTAGEGYYFFQDSSQLGFSDFTFTYDSSTLDTSIQEKDELENAVDPTQAGISTVKADAANANAPIYNMAGQRVEKSYKGVVIQNGRKFVNK